MAGDAESHRGAQPDVVVPVHFKCTPLTLAAVAHTRGYLAAFDAVATTRKFDEIVRAMTKISKRRPDWWSELGAKVAAGEMPKWD